jgi:muconolactone D-isomerase
MLFYVSMNVRIPHEALPEKIGQLTSREHERAMELQNQGKWLHAWRVAGKWANISIFDVESPGELHDILNSLPLYPFMEIEVRALCAMAGFQENTK